MIHELREYEFTVNRWPGYWRLFREVGFPIRGHDYGRLLGAWKIDLSNGRVGFTHLWEYDSLDARARSRRDLAEQPQWTRELLSQAAALVDRQSLSVLNPLQATLALQSQSGVSWMCRIRVQPGMAGLLAETLSTAGLTCWTAEFPDPNEVAMFDSADDHAIVLESFAGHVKSIRMVELVALSDF